MIPLNGGGPPDERERPTDQSGPFPKFDSAPSENQTITDDHGTTRPDTRHGYCGRLVDAQTKPYRPVAIMSTPGPGWTARVDLRDRQDPSYHEVDVLPVLGWALVDDDGERAIEPLIWWAGSPHTVSDLRWFLDGHHVRVHVVPPASVEAVAA